MTIEEIDHIPSFDITVKRETIVDDMFEIYSLLFKDEATKREDISFEELCGGFVNAIWKVTPKKDKNRSLIFRSFGMKFDETEMTKKMAEMSENGKQSEDGAQNPDDMLFFSRISEYKVMQVVSKHGLSQPVYATYKNGIVYGYTEGVTLTGELMLTNDFLKEAATKFARFHSIKYEVPGIKFKTQLERIDLQFGPPFEAMLREADDKLEQEGRPYPYSEMPRVQEQFEYEDKIMTLLREAGLGRVVLCHNDANQKNLIWNPQTRSLGFIDFEMTMANHCEFELGYLFSCFAGHFLYNYDQKLFPNEDYRRLFLRVYLEEFYKLNGLDASSEEFETELGDLFHRVNLAALRNIIDWTGLGAFFDFNPAMFQNPDFTKEREKDKYFCGKFSLKIYRLFQEHYEKLFEDAKRHFAKRKQASS